MSTDANALTIVRPLAVTDTILDSTDVPENDYAEWSVGTTYALGDRVILAATHRIYESLQASNTGNSPTALASAFWIDAGPTNRWAVFDTSVSTQTVQASNITYTLIPNEAINSIGILNIGLGIKYGARVGIQDYSRKETNTFGETVLVQRAFAKRANFNLFINKAEVDSFQNTLSTIRAVPVLWIGSDEYEATTLFGFYKNFDILISYPEHSDCELEIEGLI